MITPRLLLVALFTVLCLGARAELASAAEQIKPLAPGASAPAPKLVAADGSEFDLRAAFAAKPTVLIFYRGGWCPFCNVHLAALAELELELRTLGYQIVAITPDRPEKLNPTAEKNHVRYRLLSDREMRAASAYGVAYRMPAATEAAYLARGDDLAPLPGGGHWLPVPSVFIVTRDGTIKFAHANPDHRQRIKNADLLAAAKAAAK